MRSHSWFLHGTQTLLFCSIPTADFTCVLKYAIFDPAGMIAKKLRQLKFKLIFKITEAN